MNLWLIAATLLLLAMIPCGIVILTGTLVDSLIAFEMAGVLAVLILVLLAQGYGQPSFFDLALALGLLSLPTGLVFAHFLEQGL